MTRRTPAALGTPLASTGRSADTGRNSSSCGVMTNSLRPPGPRRPLRSSSPGPSRCALQRSSSISRCVPWGSPGLLRQQILCSLRLCSPDSCASRERQRSSPPVMTDPPRQTLISTVFTKKICANRPQPCRIASTRSRPAMSCPFSGKPVLQASRSISSPGASSSAGSSPRLTHLRKLFGRPRREQVRPRASTVSQADSDKQSNTIALRWPLAVRIACRP